MNIDSFIDGLDAPTHGEKAHFTPAQLASVPPPAIHKEIVVDKTGQPRQAGASQAEGAFIRKFRIACERDLYVFSKGVMGRDYLTKTLHLPVCKFIQQTPPARKLVIMPREHAKTSLGSHCFPVHVLIQPVDNNIYFPGLDGCECRILLSGETEKTATRNLRVITSVFEGNQLFRALWPHRCWESPRRQARAWNSSEIIIPRATEWPDPSIRAVGVGGAITGARPNVLLKDDLISVEAANSEVVMETAIEWHRVSRALLEEYERESRLQSLELIVGTRWAVHDLYSYIIENDPTVEVIDERFHRIIRDGHILWPERITEEFIEQKRKEYGTMFFLLYLNSAADPSLTDFDMEQIRSFTFHKGDIRFKGDERDVTMLERREGTATADAIPEKVVVKADASMWDILRGRGEYMRLKYADGRG